MSKKINQLTAITTADAKNDSFYLPQAHPTTGLAQKISVAQMKEVYGTKKIKYVATGSEGSTLTIATLAGKQILLITRGAGVIYEIGASPDSDEYTWNDTDIVLGTPVNTGEKFNILYRTY